MFPDSPRPMSMVTSTKWAISGVRQSFEPFRKRVPSFDAPLHRSVATLRLTGSPAPSEADDVALAKGAAKGGGRPICMGPIRRNLMRVPIGDKIKAGPGAVFPTQQLR